MIAQWRTTDDALESVGIYLTWVPPDHAHAAQENYRIVQAELTRLRRVEE